MAENDVPEDEVVVPDEEVDEHVRQGIPHDLPCPVCQTPEQYRSMLAAKRNWGRPNGR